MSMLKLRTKNINRLRRMLKERDKLLTDYDQSLYQWLYNERIIELDKERCQIRNRIKKLSYENKINK